MPSRVQELHQEPQLKLPDGPGHRTLAARHEPQHQQRMDQPRRFGKTFERRWGFQPVQQPLRTLEGGFGHAEAEEGLDLQKEEEEEAEELRECRGRQGGRSVVAPRQEDHRLRGGVLVLAVYSAGGGDIEAGTCDRRNG